MEFVQLYLVWMAMFADGRGAEPQYCEVVTRMHDINLELAIELTEADTDIDRCF